MSTLDFGQRFGFKPVPTAIQVDSIDDGLRTALWNSLQEVFWSDKRFLYGDGRNRSGFDDLARLLWRDFFNQPIDNISHRQQDTVRWLRDWFFKAEWFDVYGFLEFMLRLQSPRGRALVERVAIVLERHKSGYRFVTENFVAITNTEEITAIESAAANRSQAATSRHIKRAVELYASREAPDYRNSIKESISAIESISRQLTGKDDLAAALAELERKRELHPVLKQGFIKLYGYTNDGTDIRHAVTEDNIEVSEADAKYMLVTCSAFVNYLISRYGG